MYSQLSGKLRYRHHFFLGLAHIAVDEEAMAKKGKPPKHPESIPNLPGIKALAELLEGPIAGRLDAQKEHAKARAVGLFQHVRVLSHFEPCVGKIPFIDSSLDEQIAYALHTVRLDEKVIVSEQDYLTPTGFDLIYHRFRQSCDIVAFLAQRIQAESTKFTFVWAATRTKDRIKLHR